ncbi:MAG TPA: PHP domain-containing protein [Vicinamibacteria bacterium]|nr:PHP domain-containing protein [Vicinamibacteria bacterium]
MPKALYDLHSHTTASDGTLSPSELMRLAKTAGLRAIAVTDHDTVDGLSEAEVEAKTLGVELIPGVEVSATFGDVPVHVLGLFIDYHESWLREWFAEAHHRRVERVHRIVSRLAAENVQVTVEEVLARSSHGSVGRPHVAEVLVERGIVSSLAEAFDRYLGADRPAYVAYEKVTVKDAVGLIRRAGGIASLAHPVLLGDDRLIPKMVTDGIGALEAFHHDHTPEKAAEYERLAKALGVLVTGGSDFHRLDGDSVKRLGCEELTAEAFELLRDRAR